MFAGTFAPRNWAFCDGQLMPVASLDALFSLVGTTYGGDGRSSFGLPDMRGRLPMHQGAGPGLTTRKIGESFGQERVTLTLAQMPQHNHLIQASTSIADSSPLDGRVLASQSDGDMPYINSPDSANVQEMDSQTVSKSGGGQSHGNMMPYTCLNFIIALQGTYPSRN
ncbi:phage tail protein [Cognaticolwellia mytili]|uniref:phage tail protein n=1 Tax=Cognaticolwellia mytili TaxID=1888913 RepID=UPI001F2DD217|nr:tail fiber protein [Cognaticolwellia mytili]